MEGGDVRSIAGLCRQYVQKKLEAEKTFSVESLLKDRELAQACYMAHFFALVGKDRTYILHELKDKEYVLWLLNHPEVFEKLSFAGKGYSGSPAQHLAEGREGTFRGWP